MQNNNHDTQHLFPYKWYLSNGYPGDNITMQQSATAEPTQLSTNDNAAIGNRRADAIIKHNLKVFGTFICGGGSTMGYKLAGYDHLGGIEIDKRMAEIYKVNHNPKYFYLEDIREFNKRTDLPPELYDLDILDGSPPCSTFSITGKREKTWGKEKVFREGQKKQTLDDLVFIYCETIEKLRPKVAILENVLGIIQGNAKAYTIKIVAKLKSIGYTIQVFKINAASLGVPQARERIFFIAHRNDLKFPKLKLFFDEKRIPFSQIKDQDPIITLKFTPHDQRIWENRKRGDRDYSDTLLRIDNNYSNWSAKYLYDFEVCSTVVSADASKLVLFSEPRMVTDRELITIGSFPQDYNFLDTKVKYVIGMSVPPIMTAQIAHQIYLQWFNK